MYYEHDIRNTEGRRVHIGRSGREMREEKWAVRERSSTTKCV